MPIEITGSKEDFIKEAKRLAKTYRNSRWFWNTIGPLSETLLRAIEALPDTTDANVEDTFKNLAQAMFHYIANIHIQSKNPEFNRPTFYIDHIRQLFGILQYKINTQDILVDYLYKGNNLEEFLSSDKFGENLELDKHILHCISLKNLIDVLNTDECTPLLLRRLASLRTRYDVFKQLITQFMTTSPKSLEDKKQILNDNLNMGLHYHPALAPLENMMTLVENGANPAFFQQLHFPSYGNLLKTILFTNFDDCSEEIKIVMKKWPKESSDAIDFGYDPVRNPINAAAYLSGLDSKAPLDAKTLLTKMFQFDFGSSNEVDNSRKSQTEYFIQCVENFFNLTVEGRTITQKDFIDLADKRPSDHLDMSRVVTELRSRWGLSPSASPLSTLFSGAKQEDQVQELRKFTPQQKK